MVVRLLVRLVVVGANAQKPGEEKTAALRSCVIMGQTINSVRMVVCQLASSAIATVTASKSGKDQIVRPRLSVKLGRIVE